MFVEFAAKYQQQLENEAKAPVSHDYSTLPSRQVQAAERCGSTLSQHDYLQMALQGRHAAAWIPALVHTVSLQLPTVDMQVLQSCQNSA
jgi:hypothetical protein